MNKIITVEILVQSELATVWEFWTNPDHITKWLHASDDWECPYAENVVQIGGKFLSRMSAKDGSTSFDFSGEYTDVVLCKKLAYTIEGGRTVAVSFKEVENGVLVTESFEIETINPEEHQRDGWQAILENFKKYTEQSAKK